jgi:hypothetical protein
VVFSFHGGAKLRLSKLSLGFPSPSMAPPHDPMGVEAHSHVFENWAVGIIVSNSGGLMYICVRTYKLFAKIASRLSPESSSAFTTGHALDAHMTSSNN